MKRAFSLVLSLLLLLGGSLALAEAQTIEITFEGTYLESEDFGFKIYLPNEWVVFEHDDYYLYVGAEDETQVMAIDVLEAGGATLMEIAEAVAAEEGIDGINMLTINGIEFAIYTAQEEGFFGAFTNTGTNVYCLHFIFAPAGDEAFEDLATQIMASVDTL